MNHAFGFDFTNHIFIVDLCRYSYYYSAIGNILGSPESMRSGSHYFAPTNGTLDNSQPAIYRLGFPNTGNNCVTCGTVFINYMGGSGTMVFGYPIIMDAAVSNTLALINNYDFVNDAIQDGSTNIPSSFIYGGAPSFMSGYTYPPASPSDATMALIPAQERFYSEAISESSPGVDVLGGSFIGSGQIIFK